MLGYISSTRKKSCHSCVKSKRRCDLGYPCCKRCFTKGLDCTYPNASVHEAEVVVRQSTPDVFSTANDAAGSTHRPQCSSADHAHSSLAIDPALLSPDSSSASPDSLQDEHCQSTCSDPEPRLREGPLSQVWPPFLMSQGQIVFAVKRLCSFIPSMVCSGHTPFMHESLYRDFQPSAYQDSCSLSALYLMKTSENIVILTNSIDSKISALITSSSGWSLSEHLAAVQALIIYQIIRLFDPDLRLQAIANKQNTLLELWTAHLWKRSFNEPNPFNTCYESWVFYESLRRTVLMSVFLRSIWNAVTRGGWCDLSPILARLPLTRDGMLWECNYVEWVNRLPCKKEYLVAYGDLSTSWKPGDAMDKLSEFERLLLAACRGKDDPRLLSC